MALYPDAISQEEEGLHIGGLKRSLSGAGDSEIACFTGSENVKAAIRTSKRTDWREMCS